MVTKDQAGGKRVQASRNVHPEADVTIYVHQKQAGQAIRIRAVGDLSKLKDNGILIEVK